MFRVVEQNMFIKMIIRLIQFDKKKQNMSLLSFIEILYKRFTDGAVPVSGVCTYQWFAPGLVRVATHGNLTS